MAYEKPEGQEQGSMMLWPGKEGTPIAYTGKITVTKELLSQLVAAFRAGYVNPKTQGVTLDVIGFKGKKYVQGGTQPKFVGNVTVQLPKNVAYTSLEDIDLDGLPSGDENEADPLPFDDDEDAF